MKKRTHLFIGKFNLTIKHNHVVFLIKVQKNTESKNRTFVKAEKRKNKDFIKLCNLW